MKITLIVIGIITFGVVIYYLTFPEGTFIMVPLGTKGDLVFSKTGVSYEPPPEKFQKKGLDEIAPFISKLNKPSSNNKSIIIFLPEKDEGVLLSSKNGQLKISLSVTLIKQPKKEDLIRKYFEKVNIIPVHDYLAQDNTIRIIDYNLSGTDNQLTELLKDVLINIFNYKDSEILDIQYNET